MHEAKLTELLSDYKLAKRQCLVEKEQTKQLRSKLKTLEECQRILQSIAKEVQEQSHKAIASLVTRCLKTVLGEDSYEFRINFEQRRGRTEADLVFVEDGREVDPLSASGGGVVDIASFALRLACLVLAKPKRRQLLVLDESFKHLSAEYQPIMRELLLTLSKELRIQMILVTHSRLLQCGKVIEL